MEETGTRPIGDVTYERVEPVATGVEEVERIDHFSHVGRDAQWVRWPVYWPAVFVGGLSALALAFAFGLVAAAVGAQQMGPSRRLLTYGDIGFGALVFGILGSFLAFAAGGWVAAKIAGFRRAEPAMLHGAISFLVVVPFLMFFTAIGSGAFVGGWYGGFAGMPAWVAPNGAVVAPAPAAAVNPPGATAVRPVPNPNTPAVADPDAARAARNSALGAATALLLGLVGAVIGGWAASGEPMTFTHYRTRSARIHPAAPAAVHEVHRTAA